MAQMVKNLPAMREMWGSIPGFGRSPGGEHDFLLLLNSDLTHPPFLMSSFLICLTNTLNYIFI